MAGFPSYLALFTEKPRGVTPGGSPDNFRWDIIAGPHGTRHQLDLFVDIV